MGNRPFPPCPPVRSDGAGVGPLCVPPCGPSAGAPSTLPAAQKEARPGTGIRAPPSTPSRRPVFMRSRYALAFLLRDRPGPPSPPISRHDIRSAATRRACHQPGDKTTRRTKTRLPETGVGLSFLLVIRMRDDGCHLFPIIEQREGDDGISPNIAPRFRCRHIARKIGALLPH